MDRLKTAFGKMQDKGPRYDEGSEDSFIGLSSEVSRLAKGVGKSQEAYLQENGYLEQYHDLLDKTVVNEIAATAEAAKEGTLRYNQGRTTDFIKLSNNLHGLINRTGKSQDLYLEEKGLTKQYNDVLDQTALSEIAATEMAAKKGTLRYNKTGYGDFIGLSINLHELAKKIGKDWKTYLNEKSLSEEFEDLACATAANEIAVAHECLINGQLSYRRSNVENDGLLSLELNLHNLAKSVEKDVPGLLASMGNFDFKVHDEDVAVSKFAIVEAFNGNNRGITKAMLDNALADAPEANGIREKFEEQALRFAAAANLGCFWRNTLPQRFSKM